MSNECGGRIAERKGRKMCRKQPIVVDQSNAFYLVITVTGEKKGDPSNNTINWKGEGVLPRRRGLEEDEHTSTNQKGGNMSDVSLEDAIRRKPARREMSAGRPIGSVEGRGGKKIEEGSYLSRSERMGKEVVVKGKGRANQKRSRSRRPIKECHGDSARLSRAGGSVQGRPDKMENIGQEVCLLTLGPDHPIDGENE